MNELREVADHINNEGLPNNESMRADIEMNDRNLLQQTIEKKLNEYTVLFNKFKAGEDLTNEEVTSMTELSDELHQLAQKLHTV